MTRVAAVVIGRNEAANLPRCLSSVSGHAAPIVFVDSGSDDDSVERARRLGADVVELDPTTPFTVGRARNAGLVRAVCLDPAVAYIQFVDADSRIAPAWLEHAAAALADEPGTAAVFGRVREREPRRSVYARLYQAEFDKQFSAPDVCGGMAMMRIAAVQQMGGFDATLAGFEDAELVMRLRRAGWTVRRLNAEMAVHEARMTRFAQWWRRQTRSGDARAHQVTLHAGAPERAALREWCSVWFWGLVLPAAAVAPALRASGRSLLLLAAYPLFFLRIYRREQRGGLADAAALYAAACVLGKFPQAIGQTRFHTARLTAAVRRWLS